VTAVDVVGSKARRADQRVPCLFCGDLGQRGREHVLSGTLAKHLPRFEGPFAVSRFSADPSNGDWTTVYEYLEPQMEGFIGNDFCRACNSGWMREMDEEVEPLLGPMIRGVETALPAKAQHALATWVVKFALVLESLRGTDRSVPDAVYLRFHAEPSPLDGYPVHLAHYVGTKAHYRWVCQVQGFPAQASTPPRVENVLLTVVLGHLLIETSLPGADHRWDIEAVPGDDRLLIWPLPFVPVKWPPSRAIDDEAFANRWPTLPDNNSASGGGNV
jgi:hypothetical protein